MADYVAFALIGLGVGSFYAALATGLIVTHRGTGVINFAAGAMGSWGVYVADELRTTGDLVLPIVVLPHRIDLGPSVSVGLSIAGGVASATLVGVVAHVLVFRPLRAAPVLGKVIATVGVMLVMQAMIVANFGPEPRQVGAIISARSIAVGSLTVPGDRLVVAAVAVVTTSTVAAYFAFSRLGLATVAGAENERAIASARFSPQLLAGIAWALASASTSLILILASPFTVITPVVFTVAVVPALAAVMLARLSSLTVALVAGFGLGSINAIVTFASIKPWWPDWARAGVSEALQFSVLAVVLFFVGRRLPVRGAAFVAPLPEVHLPRNRPVVVLVATGAAIAAVALTSGSYRFGVITSMIVAIIALSLVVLTGLVGQISLAQAAFAGTAGFALARLGPTLGLPFPLTPALAVVIAAGLGVIVGLPALRIRGAHLAVVTLGLAVVVERFIFRNPALSPGTGNAIDDPVLFGLDLGVREGRTIARLEFGLLVVVVLVVVFVAVGNIARGSTGRRFLAVRSDEVAAAGVGVDVAKTKLVGFALSSLLAGVGGVLLGYSRGQLSADSFTVFVGLSILTFAYLGGITSLSGALVAGSLAPLGIAFVIVERQLDLGRWYLLASGVGLILTAIFNPVGIAGAMRALLVSQSNVGGQRDPVGAGRRHAAQRAQGPRTDGVDAALFVDDVSVSFDGLRAVDRVTLDVRRGEIVGLIGANGAGKTTLLDAIGGLVDHEGAVRIANRAVEGLEPHERARAGVGRTWQSIQLFTDLSVADNVRVAIEPQAALSVVLDAVRPRSAPVLGSLAALGLGGVADRRPAELSLGRQKLVGLARAMASRPAVVLLDEPAAGLDEEVRRDLAANVVDLAATGVAVLIVDHDMTFVLDVCHHVYVLDFGRMIAEGTPSEIRVDPAVASAYLGASPALST